MSTLHHQRVCVKEVTIDKKKPPIDIPELLIDDSQFNTDGFQTEVDDGPSAAKVDTANAPKKADRTALRRGIRVGGRAPSEPRVLHRPRLGNNRRRRGEYPLYMSTRNPLRVPRQAPGHLRTLLDAPLADPARLGRVTARTLIVGGTADQFFGDGMQQQTAALVPNMTLALFPGETHMVPIERPRAVAATLRAFLTA